VLTVRESRRVVNVHVVMSTGVKADGHHEIVGLQVPAARTAPAG
jgi:putative transposase